MPAAGAIVIDLAKTLVGRHGRRRDDRDRRRRGRGHAASSITSAGCRAASAATPCTSSRRRAAPWTAHWVWSAGAAASHDAMATGTGVGAALDVPAGDTAARGRRLAGLARGRAREPRRRGARDRSSTPSPPRRRLRGRRSSSTVLITGGTDVQRRIFYTSLYHAFLMPTVIDDVDGSYQLAGQPVTIGGRLSPDVGSVAVGHVSHRVVALRVARARERARLRRARSSASATGSARIRSGRSRSARPARCSARARRS